MAYPSKIIAEGSFSSFQAAEAIPLYARVKFNTTPADDGSGKPQIVLADGTERSDGVAMQPIASGAYGTIKFMNSPGEQFGLASGSITLGASVYAATDGKVTASSAGSAKLLGTSTSIGADGGTLTYLPISATA